MFSLVERENVVQIDDHLKYDLDRMYEPNIKQEYLETRFNDETETKRTVANTFYHSNVIEVQLGYDLYNFNLEEIVRVLHACKPLTKSVAAQRGRVISSYIKWALEKGYSENNSNPMSSITKSDWYDQFIDKHTKLYLSKQEIDDIEKDLVNAQDKALLYLIFEGVFGTSGSAVLNLKKSDIDFENNTLHVSDDELGERDVEVSPFCIKLIKDAMKEERYQAKNGTGEGRNADRPLIENDYVLRNAKTRSEHNDRADKHLIYRRISMICELFDYPELNAKNIERSGMIYYAKELLLKKAELGYEELEEVAERFGQRKAIVNGSKQYNMYSLREFINVENIIQLYGG